jgi:hypothetical protein
MDSHRVDIQAGGDVRARQVAGRDVTTVKRRTVKIGLAGWLPSSVAGPHALAPSATHVKTHGSSFDVIEFQNP